MFERLKAKEQENHRIQDLADQRQVEMLGKEEVVVEQTAALRTAWGQEAHEARANQECQVKTLASAWQ